MWAVSAVAKDGSVVVSCWQHLFLKTAAGVMPYQDNLSRWSTNNPHGSKLLGEHLKLAFAEHLTLRLVLARHVDKVSGDSMNANGNAFHTRKDLVGRVTEFDGDNFRLEFTRASA